MKSENQNKKDETELLEKLLAESHEDIDLRDLEKKYSLEEVEKNFESEKLKNENSVDGNSTGKNGKNNSGKEEFKRTGQKIKNINAQIIENIGKNNPENNSNVFKPVTKKTVFKIFTAKKDVNNFFKKPSNFINPKLDKDLKKLGDKENKPRFKNPTIKYIFTELSSFKLTKLNYNLGAQIFAFSLVFISLITSVYIYFNIPPSQKLFTTMIILLASASFGVFAMLQFLIENVMFKKILSVWSTNIVLLRSLVLTLFCGVAYFLHIAGFLSFWVILFLIFLYYIYVKWLMSIGK